MRPVKYCVQFFILVLFLLSGCVRQINMHEGIESFNHQDFRRAFIRLKPEAERGNPDAQYAVGYMYYYGQGVVEDRQKAFEWIAKAASCGHKDAMKALAMIDKPRLKAGEYSLHPKALRKSRP